MDLMQIRRMIIMMQPVTAYGGIPVYADNAYYPPSGGLLTGISRNSGFFIAGPFDTGSTDKKSFTFSRITVLPPGESQVVWRIFNDITARSVNYWSTYAQSGTPRTVTSAGRYIYATIPKSVAADMYMYMTVGDERVYLYKGKNVT